MKTPHANHCHNSFKLLLQSCLAFSLIACGLFSPALNLPLNFEAPSPTKIEALKQSSAIKSHENFARKLMPLVLTGKSNQTFSPLSVSVLMHLLLNGSGGETYTAMSQALNWNTQDLSQLNQDNEVLLKALQTADDQVLLRIANSIWWDPERPNQDKVAPVRSRLNNGFVQQGEQYYLAEVAAIDFDKQTTSAQINQWVSHATQDKITHIVGDTTQDHELILILINAIYMQARWKHQFNPDKTSNQVFYTREDLS